MQSIFPSTKKKRKKQKVTTQGKKKVGKKLQLSRLSITLLRWQNVIYDLGERFLRANFFESSILSRDGRAWKHGGDTAFLRQKFDFYDRARFVAGIWNLVAGR